MGSLKIQTPTGSHLTPTISAFKALKASRATSMPAGGVFSNMAFAVSIKDGGTNRFQIEKSIRANGGLILQEGFDELFHISRSDGAEKDTSLRLLADFENLGFVSLITDEHTRRVKYMQALALNLPCLAYRWVQDCIEKNCLLDWDPYLLPAGESKFLNGAVKSRMLAPYSPSSAQLSEIVNQRYKLLAGQSVIFVTAKGKAAEARRAYAFLLYAMGAKTVLQVQDVNAAVRTLKQGNEECVWDWIYVGDESSAPAACDVLLEEFGARVGPLRDNSGTGKSTTHKQPKKRGRRSGSGVGGVGSPNVMTDEPIMISGKKLRVLVNDFICQSLILGRLYPDYG
ncbi:hypothetical protein KEM54_002360 [Ascosphaera aggregata]|nr:hypothetical protein KEM54_002360 [Ascosphaera aggregata]